MTDGTAASSATVTDGTLCNASQTIAASVTFTDSGWVMGCEARR